MSWKYDVVSKISRGVFIWRTILQLSSRSSWNYEALGCFEERRPNKKNNKNKKNYASTDMGSVPDPKSLPFERYNM